MISLRTLMLADDDDVVQDIMETNVISANTLEDQESVAQMFTKYDFSACRWWTRRTAWWVSSPWTTHRRLAGRDHRGL